jgi:hypothetical protein
MASVETQHGGVKNIVALGPAPLVRVISLSLSARTSELYPFLFLRLQIHSKEVCLISKY